MANIFAILHGQPTFADLCTMTIAQLMLWHERARARAPKD